MERALPLAHPSIHPQVMWKCWTNNFWANWNAPPIDGFCFHYRRWLSAGWVRSVNMSRMDDIVREKNIFNVWKIIAKCSDWARGVTIFRISHRIFCASSKVFHWTWSFTFQSLSFGSRIELLSVRINTSHCFERRNFDTGDIYSGTHQKLCYLQLDYELTTYVSVDEMFQLMFEIAI